MAHWVSVKTGCSYVSREGLVSSNIDLIRPEIDCWVVTEEPWFTEDHVIISQWNYHKGLALAETVHDNLHVRLKRRVMTTPSVCKCHTDGSILGFNFQIVLPCKIQRDKVMGGTRVNEHPGLPTIDLSLNSQQVMFGGFFVQGNVSNLSFPSNGFLYA